MLTKVILIVSVAFVALTSARPGYLHGHHHAHLDYPLLHHEPLHVAKYVHVPAAISHQSSTVIHSAPIIKPIVVPVVKHVLPIVKTYHPAPIINTIHSAPLHYDPFYHHHFDHHDLHHYH
ncbi:histidine-rich glycoprotein [Calliphora vicina]|uniref:histidine-rich glycoprotein n=1 Tax=Calliphora vicina TaxID=7373 RepID=UPI00325A698F